MQARSPQPWKRVRAGNHRGPTKAIQHKAATRKMAD